MVLTVVIEIHFGPMNIWKIQWNPSWKARNVSLKLQNLVHFRAPFITNHVFLPLMTGHLFWKATILGAFIGGFHLYIQTWRKKIIYWMESLIKLWVYKLQLPIFYELSNFQSFVIVVRLLRASRLSIWLVPKLPVIILVAISRLWLGTGLLNRRFNFLLY